MSEHEPQIFEPQEFYIIDQAGDERSLFLDTKESTLCVDTDDPIALTDIERLMMLHFLAYPDTPFKLAEMRSAVGITKKDPIRMIDICMDLLTKAPFLEGHIVAVVHTKTQFYGFLPEARQIARFENEFNRSLPYDYWDHEGSFFKDVHRKRRHDRVKKVVETALATTVAVSAIIGYKHFRKQK